MTMYRYMVFMRGRADIEAARAAKFLATKLCEVSPHRWSHAWAGADIAILHSGEYKGRMQTYRLKGERGAILGRLFRNDSDYTSVVANLDEFESRKCLETRGQKLIDDYWGRYVAFLNDPVNGTRYVIRDPSGAFPCFHTSFRGVTIYFSDMQDVANFEFLPFTINWSYLKTSFKLPLFQQVHTGLKEVGEVLPAECVEVTPSRRSSRFVWDPAAISQTDVVKDAEQAAAQLRSTIRCTTRALADCYDRVIHNLGGLDSSILLSCLANAPKRLEVTCINYHTNSPRGEERFYCRQVATSAGIPLVESELDYRKADINKMFTSNMLAKPLAFLDCIGLTGDVARLARKREAQALFYGTGGDNVFYQPARNLSALDYVRQHGFGKDALRIAMEASRYGRKSLFNTVHEMLKERFAPAPCYEYVYGVFFEDLKLPLVNRDFIADSSYRNYLHPLLIPKDHDLKGKYLHIMISALLPVEYYDHWDIDYYAERIRPYLTQPVLETCLRIPTWIMSHGGIERGLARKAFRFDLPDDIVRRVSKCTPSDYYRDIYRHNLEFLREVLLDGLLVDERILCREKVEKALNKEELLLRVSHSQVLGYAATEAWARRWAERPHNPADLA